MGPDNFLRTPAPSLDRLRPFGGRTPHRFAGCGVHARERRIRLVAPIETVQIAVLMNRGVEMQSELLRRPELAMREVGPNLDQRAARAVARRDEDLVVEYDRTGRVHRLVGAAAPRE